jgi:hypothetical protein
MRVPELEQLIDKMLVEGPQAGADVDSFDDEFKRNMDELAILQKTINNFEARNNSDVYTERQVTT